MLGLDGYGSGSEGESENEKQKVINAQPAAARASAGPKPTINLPPPTNSSSSSKISLPPPKTTKRAPRKITIGLPALPKDDNEERDVIESERPAAKRQKTGAGGSSLLTMLPAPKQKAPTASQPERVLGGGKGPGLVFNTRPTVAPAQSRVFVEEDEEQEEGDGKPGLSTPAKPAKSTTVTSGGVPLPFLPPSLVKGKANISLEDKPKTPLTSAAPPVDFFSLESSKAVSTASSSFSLPTLSAAPSVPTFEPPEPTPQDPYPGYYQLPSGSLAAYDSTYYEEFRKKWQTKYDAYVRGLEKGTIKGFEGYEGASEVDAMKEMEKAKVEIKEREERKALTKGATGPTEEPKMKFNASKLSGIARSRHQLSTLLRDAYQNREALEEKIAEGRRNRKEAGNKYGF